jgi:hypothetical protein
MTFIDTQHNNPTRGRLDFFARIFGEVGAILAHAPFVLLFTLVLVGALLAFSQPVPPRAEKRRWFIRTAFGTLHGVFHIVLIVLLFCLFTVANLSWLGFDSFTVAQVALFTSEMVLVGGLVGSLLMAVYLYLADRLFQLNSNELFSAQGIADLKNFLRLHIDTRGNLTVYPIGVENVVKSWKFVHDAPSGTRWFTPEDGDEPESHLIEEPISITGT